MAWVRLAAEAVVWSEWLWRHRSEFEPTLKGLGDVGQFAQAALANPNGALRRVGNALVFGQPDGGEKVLAFIEQTAPRIEHVEQAVNGLQAGQATLAASLGSLQTLSMVTLGLSAFSSAVLAAQLFALKRRLGELQRQVARLHAKFDAAVAADLRAGLDLLRQGQDFLQAEDRANADSRLTSALPLCMRTVKYYGDLLGGELNGAAADRGEVRLLARHLAVAVTGVASCQVGLRQDAHAFAQSGQELGLLREAAAVTFTEAVANDPVPFMHPAMREHGVTIGFMAQLYRQARDAGAVDAGEDCSPAAWFEEHRNAIFRARRPWLGWDTKELLSRLREAVAAVEETNRVVGLSRLVEEMQTRRRNTLDAMEQFRRDFAGQDVGAFPYAVWGVC
jgi:hypothetical protein